MELKQELINACKENKLYDFIALNYNKFSKQELATIIKECAYLMYQDNINQNELVNGLKEYF